MTISAQITALIRRERCAIDLSRRQRVNFLRLAHARDKWFIQMILFICRNEMKCRTIMFHNKGYARESRSLLLSHLILTDAILYLLYLLWCDGNDLLLTTHIIYTLHYFQNYTYLSFVCMCWCIFVFFHNVTRKISSVDLRTLTDETHNVASSRLCCPCKVRLMYNTPPRPVN